jgi:tetratricopeptide (TPR) repeat protein
MTSSIEDINNLNALNAQVVQLVEQGKLDVALDLAQQAVSFGQKLQITEHSIFTDSLNNLAELYRLHGRYTDTENLYQQALNLRKKLFGKEHINVAESLNNLAVFHFSLGKYSPAEQGFLTVFKIWQRLLGDEHPQVAIVLNNLAEVYRKQGRYSDAENIYSQVLEIQKFAFGDEHHDIWRTFNNLAALYETQGRYLDAENKHLSALEMIKSLFGETHPDVTVSLNNLAALYDSQGRYLEAEQNYLEVLASWKRLLGDEHPLVASALNNIAANHKEQGRYLEAEQMHLSALAMRKRLLGDQHPDVANSLSNLAEIYFLQGRYLAAEQIYLQANEIRNRLFTSEHPDIAYNSINLARNYAFQGRFFEAEQIYLQALPMLERLLGKGHLSVANSSDDLALLYQMQGQYSKAEQIYLEGYSIRKNILGENHPDVATSLNDIAVVYRLQGRYSEAEQTHLTALVMIKELLGAKHHLVAAMLNNLAVLYDAQFKYSQAESLLLEALAIVKSVFGDEHPQAATSMNNLATIYGSQQRYIEAEQLHLSVLKIRTSLFGKEHPDIPNSLNNLALIYLSLGRYEEAEQKYLEALSMRKHLLGDKHPDTALSLNNLATVLAAMERYSDALSYRIQASCINDLMINSIFAFSSESDRLAFIEKLRGNFNLFLSLVYKHLSNSESALQAALDFVLKRKALTATSLAAQNEALYSNRYPHLKEKFSQLSKLNAQLVNLTVSAAQRQDFADFQKKLAQLEAESNDLQKQLAAQVPEIQLSEQLPDRFAVAEALPIDSVLVEFVRFDFFNFQAVPAKGETQWYRARYLAFVLKAGLPDAVQMFDLGEAEVIDELISVLRLQLSDSSKKTLGWASILKLPTKEYDLSTAIQLCQLLFGNFREALEGYKHLILAPDGNLNLLPFQILPLDETGKHLLMDEYTISYLGVGRDILRSGIKTERTADVPLIIADPDFDLASEQAHGQTNELLAIFGCDRLSRTQSTGFLGEIVAQKLLNARLYLGAEALETHLTTSKCPHIMLIATHGLFLPDSPPIPPIPNLIDPKTQIPKLKLTNPMTRSALALAGANTGLTGGSLPPKAGKGVVFAQDIAALDLWANEITVLSACDTARGDIKIGEGVFGLRRAFTVAGAKTLVMSLWQVPDPATALLMERFFDNLLCGMGRVEALQSAQDYIRKITVKELRDSALGLEVLKELLELKKLSADTEINCQEQDTPLEHPFYWGAWICQGNTDPLMT